MSSDLSSLPSVIVGKAGWVRGFSPYLQWSLGSPLGRVPISQCPTLGVNTSFTGPASFHHDLVCFLLQKNQQKSIYLVGRVVLEPFSLEERISAAWACRCTRASTAVRADRWMKMSMASQAHRCMRMNSSARRWAQVYKDEHSYPGSQVHRDEVNYLPCSSLNYSLTYPKALSSVWYSVPPAL